MKQTDLTHIRGLRTIAVMEFAKGLLVVLLGFGLITLSRHDLDLEDLASSLIYVLHLRPERRLPMAFLNAAARFDDLRLLWVAIGAAVYSVLRFTEAYGLWNGRVWAEWVALVSGMIYLPLEIYELFHKPTPFKLILLLLNVAIVLYMARIRLHARWANQWQPSARPEQAE